MNTLLFLGAFTGIAFILLGILSALSRIGRALENLLEELQDQSDV